jgi:dipeptidyl aminopeptidase/acylaminoacyl peptidase
MRRTGARGWWAVVGAGLGLLLLGAAALFVRAVWMQERFWDYPRPGAARPADLPALEDVELRTADGLRLKGWWWPSRDGAAVVLVHGLGQTRTGLLAEARLLAAAGYGVLLFDLRAHGESEGASSTWGDQERGDVRAALAHVRARPGVDPARVGLVGFSIGAAAVAEVAGEDPAVAATVLLSPFNTLWLAAAYDFRRFGALTQTAALVPFWWRGVKVEEVRPIDAVERILPRPLLIVAGGQESGQPLFDELFARVAGRAQTWRIPQAGHGGFAEAEPEAYPAALRAFLDRALRGAPAGGGGAEPL